MSLGNDFKGGAAGVGEVIIEQRWWELGRGSKAGEGRFKGKTVFF